jgi:glucosyl-3-phosphoglycerate synthase
MRSFHHTDFPSERIAAERGALTISVCVPARECATTIGGVVSALAALRGDGAIDEVVVVDAGSADGTAELGARAGASSVVQEAALEPDLGPVLGKGDAMYRALGVITSDIVCFVDGDSAAFDPALACGLIGPLVCEPGVEFVKGSYRRPFTVGDVEIPGGGGRVSQLLARPLLARFYPDLAEISQPLAGEVAARRDLLDALPIATGYAVEIAMLIDAWASAGSGAMAQCDLGERRNAHQSLSALAPMANAVLGTVAARLEREGRLAPLNGAPTAAVERPPRRPRA